MIVLFQIKAEPFNDFFSNQCSLIDNNSKLQTNLIHVTNRRLSTVIFSASDIAKIFHNLNSNNAYGHDNTSIRSLKICTRRITKLSTTDRPPTTNRFSTDPPTDIQPTHRSPTTDHRPTDRSSTDPPTTDSPTK